MGAEPEDTDAAGWRPVRLLLDDASAKLAREPIEDDLPPDFARPAATTLWRGLGWACAHGRLRRSGSGRCTDAFRDWLAENEAAGLTEHADPLQQLGEEDTALEHRLRGRTDRRPSRPP
jgi:hypothetical protein